MEREESMKYLAVILGIFGLETGIKNYIERNKEEGSQDLKCGGALIIRRHHNRGAFLNAGQERQRAVMIISVLLAALLTVLYVITLGHALLLGGAYTNTYDRVARKYVVDYVSFNVPFRWLRRIIFNIGDFCIMIGALMSVLGYCSAE